MSRILFCNIGWMEKYQGQTKVDQITSGGSYIQNGEVGHEVCNFINHNGVCYGYVQPGGRSIDLSRIDSGSKENQIENVLVVWTAKRNGLGTVIVGWYKDATVFKSCQKLSSVSESHKNNNLSQYYIKADYSKSNLLPIDERTHVIPRRTKGSIGQSNIWYADATESAQFVEKAMEFIGGDRASPKRKKKSDPEHNSKVEKSAVDLVWGYYEERGYNLLSVEKDNVGWDLEAEIGDISLKIEVKGLSKSNYKIGLTPNEYNAFKSSSCDYRLAIVKQALSNPELIIIRYSSEKNEWVVDGKDEAKILIKRIESANIEVYI